jgi:aryl-alcohol dehydrogenase-like predicted oxidoreductase
MAPVVCVQNFYNIANRRDDALIDSLAEQGIGYVPFFPLGGFTPLQSETLSNVAARLNARPMSVALAWLSSPLPSSFDIRHSSFTAHSAHSRNIISGTPERECCWR